MKISIQRLHDLVRNQTSVLLWEELERDGVQDILLTDILKRAGIDEALWFIQGVKGYKREKRLFAVWIARQAEGLLVDKYMKAADVAERYAFNEATYKELVEAWDPDLSPNEMFERFGAYDEEENSILFQSHECYVAHPYPGAAVYHTAELTRRFDKEYQRETKDKRWPMGERQREELVRLCSCIEAGVNPYPRTHLKKPLMQISA